jgi:hypothetical protein
MALIQYMIHLDETTGQATVTYSVQSIGPGDQVTFVTDTPGAAVLPVGDSPFQYPAPGGGHLPVTDANPQPLPVVKSVDASNAIQWDCGQADGGSFTKWLPAGPAFPPIPPKT